MMPKPLALASASFDVKSGERRVGPADVIAVVVVRPDDRDDRPVRARVADDFARFGVAELRAVVEHVVVEADQLHVRREEPVARREEIEVATCRRPVARGRGPVP